VGRWVWAGVLGVGLVVCVLAAVLAASATTASVEDHDVAAGRRLFVTYCAACHGDGGHGDGPSAAGLATKPANLTDGRLMSALPDEFLVTVIMQGGPAEGLAPTMPAFGPFLGADKTRQVVAYVRSISEPAYRATPALPLPPGPRQPIAFSHLIHAGSFKIDCQYCHADARRSDYAGLPSLERCLGCHKIIGAQDNPEIGKISQYAARGEPVPWVRVFKVPEFSHFAHKPHIRAGVACQSCHGPIERMRVVGAETGRSLADDLVRLTGARPPQRPLTMGWCVECHREENATHGMHAPLDCVACHH